MSKIGKKFKFGQVFLLEIIGCVPNCTKKKMPESYRDAKYTIKKPKDALQSYLVGELASEWCMRFCEGSTYACSFSDVLIGTRK